MTNDFVYGTIIHLDTVLRQIWNIMKNFANYTIWFLFLYHILKNFFSPKWNFKEFMKTKLIAFVVAWILIQMSWFLIGALLDLTTIATSAIGAFPGQIISESPSMKNTLKSEYWILAYENNNIIRQRDASTTNTNPNTPTPKTANNVKKDGFDAYLDGILPNHSSLSGPFLFLWLSVFKFQTMPVQDANTFKDIGSLLMSWSINLILMLMFTIAMFFLFLLNVVRVLTIWMLIIFSPFIILFKVMKSIGGEDMMSGDDLPEWLERDKLISAIFKPVVFTAYLSVMLIFVTGMRWVLSPKANTDSINLNDVSIQTDANGISQFTVTGVSSVKLDGLKDGFSSLIVFFFTIFLLWMLLKLAIGEWKWVLGKFMKGTMDMLASAPKQIPFLPNAGKDTGWSSIANRQAAIHKAWEKVWDKFSMFKPKTAMSDQLKALWGTSDTGISRWDLWDSESIKTFMKKTKKLLKNKTLQVFSDQDWTLTPWWTELETFLKNKNSGTPFKITDSKWLKDFLIGKWNPAQNKREAFAKWMGEQWFTTNNNINNSHNFATFKYKKTK